MKASTGVRTHASLSAGTFGRTGLWKAHHDCACDCAVDRLGQFAPLAIHFSITAISVSGSFGPGGIASSLVRRIAFTTRLPDAFPGAIAGPRVPPRIAASRE